MKNLRSKSFAKAVSELRGCGNLGFVARALRVAPSVETRSKVSVNGCRLPTCYVWLACLRLGAGDDWGAAGVGSTSSARLAGWINTLAKRHTVAIGSRLTPEVRLCARRLRAIGTWSVRQAYNEKATRPTAAFPREVVFRVEPLSVPQGHPKDF